MGLIIDVLSYAIIFIIFMITVHVYFAIPVFLYKWFSVMYDRIGVEYESFVEEEKPTPVTKQPEVVEKKGASKWDWKEYRRHSHDTSFVDASMWLSMGDD